MYLPAKHSVMTQDSELKKGADNSRIVMMHSQPDALEGLRPNIPGMPVLTGSSIFKP